MESIQPGTNCRIRLKGVSDGDCTASDGHGNVHRADQHANRNPANRPDLDTFSHACRSIGYSNAVSNAFFLTDIHYCSPQ